MLLATNGRRQRAGVANSVGPIRRPSNHASASRTELCQGYEPLPVGRRIAAETYEGKVTRRYSTSWSWFQVTPDDGEKQPWTRYSPHMSCTCAHDSDGVRLACALSSAATM